MRNYDDKRDVSIASYLRLGHSRAQSLSSIIETDDEDEAHDDSEESSQPTAPSSQQTAFRTVSSHLTSPDIFASDDVPLHDAFSSTLYNKLLRVASMSIRSSSTSSISSGLYFSPNSDAQSTPALARRLLNKRRASTSIDRSPDKENPKKPRIDGPSKLQPKRNCTLTDDGESPARKKPKFSVSRAASLRRADSLVSVWVPTVPSTPKRTPSPGVPIIAPPQHFVATVATTSRSRLNAYIQREAAWREKLSFGRLEGDVEAWEAHLGLGVRIRSSVMRWIAAVHVASFVDEEDDEMEDKYTEGLADQLAQPETRFHAAYLFLLFAYRLGWGSWNVWDLATACIAVSVKLHHDFLPPLLPIYACDLLRLPPHRMYKRDLERAQRLLLSTLDYRVGGTTSPTGILDELWDAIPRVQDLFPADEWQHVLSETWRVLLTVVAQPDMLQFSITLLTVSAVVDACQTVLTWRKADGENLERLISDLEETFQLESDDLDRCRCWLTEVMNNSEGQ